MLGSLHQAALDTFQLLFFGASGRFRCWAMWGLIGAISGAIVPPLSLQAFNLLPESNAAPPRVGLPLFGLLALAALLCVLVAIAMRLASHGELALIASLERRQPRLHITDLRVRRAGRTIATIQLGALTGLMALLTLVVLLVRSPRLLEPVLLVLVACGIALHWWVCDLLAPLVWRGELSAVPGLSAAVWVTLTNFPAVLLLGLTRFALLLLTTLPFYCLLCSGCALWMPPLALFGIGMRAATEPSGSLLVSVLGWLGAVTSGLLVFWVFGILLTPWTVIVRTWTLMFVARIAPFDGR